MTANNTSSRRG